MRAERKLSGRARVFHDHRVVAQNVEYEITVDAFQGDAIIAELRHLPKYIGPDVLLVVEVEDGRRFGCLRLDDSDFCAGIGEPTRRTTDEAALLATVHG